MSAFVQKKAPNSNEVEFPERRDFLKLAGILGVGAVVAYYSKEIKFVFGQASTEGNGSIHLIWLPMANDSGCTISMLQASNPDLIEAVQNLQISADFWQPLMTPDYQIGSSGWISAGYTTETQSQAPLINAAFGDAPVDILVVEGTPQIGAPNGGSAGDYCQIAGYTAYELLQKLAAKATWVIAIGECSSFGGIPAAAGNLTGAVAVTEALKNAQVTTKNPIVNIPGCPAHPDWTLITLSSLLQGFSPELDELGRPKAFFSNYIHDNCPRRGAYDRGEFAKTFDDPTGCYWNLGCKGPITQAACAQTKWNGGLSTCTQGGPMCWGCMHPNFPDAPTSPFFKPVELTSSFLGLNADDIGEIVTAVTVTAIGVHAAKHAYSAKHEQKVRSQEKAKPSEEANDQKVPEQSPSGQGEGSTQGK